MLSSCFLVFRITPQMTLNERSIWAFLTAFLFLNLVHTGFSLPILVGLPEYQKYFSAQRRRYFSRSIIRLCMLATLFFVGLIFFYRRGGFEADGINPDIKSNGIKFASLVIETWGILHVRRQTLGLSLLYNKSSVGKSVRLPLALPHWRPEKIEKICFDFFTIFYFVRLAVRFFISNVAYDSVKYSLLVPEILVCLLIFLLAAHAPADVRLKKCMFLSRILLFPLVPFHFIFHCGVRAIHGIEYFLMTRQLVERSQTSATKTKKIWTFAFILGSGTAVLPFLYNGMPHQFQSLFGSHYSFAILILLALSTTSVFMHYVFDGFMFKINDPNWSHNLAELFLPSGILNQPDSYEVDNF